MPERRLRAVSEIEKTVAWTPVSRGQAQNALEDDGAIRYGINYTEIVELAASGEIVEVSLEYVSESALRNGVSYWSLYTGVPIRCRVTKDRKHILVYRQGVI
jgi:hypothetical protein